MTRRENLLGGLALLGGLIGLQSLTARPTAAQVPGLLTAPGRYHLSAVVNNGRDYVYITDSTNGQTWRRLVLEGHNRPWENLGSPVRPD